MSKIYQDGEIVLYGTISEWSWPDEPAVFSARDVIEALAEHGSGPITVRINSPGGNAFEGLAIHSLLRAHDGEVTIRVEAVAASSASLVACAGDRVVMALGAMLMIHDPSTITWGDAEEHRAAADRLDKIATNFASVYAARCGRPVEEVREMMRVETWMTAEEAVDVGFADEIEGASAPPVAVDWSVFMRAPASLRAIPAPDGRQASPRSRDGRRPVRGATPAASPAATMETPMPTTDTPAGAPSPTLASPSVAAEAPQMRAAPSSGVPITDIATLAARVGLSAADAIDIAAAAPVDMAAVNAAVLDRLAARDAGPRFNAVPATVQMDAATKWATGVERALLMRAGLGGERNEFTGYSMVELARQSLAHRGERAGGLDAMTMVGRMFTMASGGIFMAGGMHTTGDFANVLANVANKAMLKGYEEADETFQLWTAVGSASDFKVQSRVGAGLFPSLDRVPEGGEYKYATMDDRGVSVVLASYGKLFAITRQAIINDDLGAFTTVPRKMGRAAIRTVGDLVYAILVANPTFAGAALFEASARKNLATGGGSVLSVASVAAGIAAMKKQTEAGGTTPLNLRPKWLLTSVELEGDATVIANSEFDPASTQRVPNKVRGAVTPVADARIATATQWYLAADANVTDTIEVTYLNGVTTPTLEQRDGWGVDGVEFKVRMDAAATPLAYQGLYRSNGA